MSSDPVPPHATQLRNHWYWRPGWNPNRSFYTWHITFEGQDQFHRLVSTYQNSLRQVSGLDLIPLRWLHLTMQGVGFTDEVQPDQARAIADVASERLANLPSVEVTFHEPIIRSEAIALAPVPTSLFRAIRNTIRDSIAAVWGEEGVPETKKEFNPHVSMAYVNMDAPAAGTLQALASVNTVPAKVTISKASLIVLRRDNHLYRWHTFSCATFSGAMERGCTSS